MSSLPSWSNGIKRTGGFYSDADWYDANMKRKMPLVPAMLEELVAALPPLGDAKVMDLLAGGGAVSIPLLKAYPRARVSVLEKCEYRIDQCKKKLRAVDEGLQLDQVFNQELEIGVNTSLPGGQYDLVVASLALHTLVGHSTVGEDLVSQKYREILSLIYNSLSPGGHLMIGDHVGVCSLYKQLRLMEDVGFVDIDVSWWKEAFFVAGARKSQQ